MKNNYIEIFEELKKMKISKYINKLIKKNHKSKNKKSTIILRYENIGYLIENGNIKKIKSISININNKWRKLW